jgi:hypothetical protein
MTSNTDHQEIQAACGIRDISIPYATNYFGNKFHIIDYVFIFIEQFPSFRDYFVFNCFINNFDITGKVKR